jgi:hypothetical protein
MFYETGSSGQGLLAVATDGHPTVMTFQQQHHQLGQQV